MRAQVPAALGSAFGGRIAHVAPPVAVSAGPEEVRLKDAIEARRYVAPTPFN
jgi:hypothetical protein